MANNWINGRQVSDADWFRELDAMAREDEIGGDHVGRPIIPRYVARDWAQGSTETGAGSHDGASQDAPDAGRSRYRTWAR